MFLPPSLKDTMSSLWEMERGKFKFSKFFFSFFLNLLNTLPFHTWSAFISHENSQLRSPTCLDFTFPNLITTLSTTKIPKLHLYLKVKEKERKWFVMWLEERKARAQSGSKGEWKNEKKTNMAKQDLKCKSGKIKRENEKEEKENELRSECLRRPQGGLDHLKIRKPNSRSILKGRGN